MFAAQSSNPYISLTGMLSSVLAANVSSLSLDMVLIRLVWTLLELTSHDTRYIQNVEKVMDPSENPRR